MLSSIKFGAALASLLLVACSTNPAVHRIKAKNEHAAPLNIAVTVSAENAERMTGTLPKTGGEWSKKAMVATASKLTFAGWIFAPIVVPAIGASSASYYNDLSEQDYQNMEDDLNAVVASSNLPELLQARVAEYAGELSHNRFYVPKAASDDSAGELSVKPPDFELEVELAKVILHVGNGLTPSVLASARLIRPQDRKCLSIRSWVSTGDLKGLKEMAANNAWLFGVNLKTLTDEAASKVAAHDFVAGRRPSAYAKSRSQTAVQSGSSKSNARDCPSTGT